jgi:hypothetical protein
LFIIQIEENKFLISVKIGISPNELRYLTMRVIGEISHPECKITIFHWNNKYLLKLELGPFEQTFKINEFDVSSEDALKKMVNEDFISQAMARFADMSRSLADASEEI